MRLLLNAEPFGFGPTAAIAAIMPYLAPHCRHIGYVGGGHTLDLQRNLPYNAFHPVDDVPWVNYDTFLTALDFDMAEQAHRHGLRVAIYDPLMWYWPKLNPSIQGSLYLAQAFYGVGERLKQEGANIAHARIVPPLVKLRKAQPQRQGVLVNLGGLQNPFWPIDKVQSYALTMAHAVRQVVPAAETITLATSHAVADYLRPRLAGMEVTSLPHHDIQDVMAGYRIAFMTPGLGNMYDASAHALPTIWLPPANDSQGRQLNLLCQHGHADGWVDWADLGHPITYAAPQPTVLRHIAEAIDHLPDARPALHRALQASWQQVQASTRPRISGLVQTFGDDGAKQVADAVVQTWGTRA